MKDGFIKVAAVSPAVRLADTEYNARSVIKAVSEAADKGAKLIVLPRLCITGATAGDMYMQKALTDAACSALLGIMRKTSHADAAICVGAPLIWEGKLYDCTVVMCKGEILGVSPAGYVTDAERRYFTPFDGKNGTITLRDKGAGVSVPFGNNLYECASVSEFTFAAFPYTGHTASLRLGSALAAAGANIIALSAAQPEYSGSYDKLRRNIAAQSDVCDCAVIYCGAGRGESVTDAVYAGRRIIAECGNVLKESSPFSEGVIVSEPDVQYTARRRMTSSAVPAAEVKRITFSVTAEVTQLTRPISARPFLPQSQDAYAECELMLDIQASALAARMQHAKAEKLLVGISGGLDSALALIAAVRACDKADVARENVIAVTMPCYGTTKRTKSNAVALTNALGATLRTVNLAKSVDMHFKDIGHDKENRNSAFENAQARERTQVLMDIANDVNGLVVGTGDMSELALGWATYNGDHMSMYAVNAGIPKTLVRQLTLHYADTCDNAKASQALHDILDTPVSPELLPATDGEISQKTEDIVGPYELHDFVIYHAIGNGFPPAKVYRLEKYVFGKEFEDTVILGWLQVFYRRFFAQQFKRSCMPDGPKVCSMSLSPRGGLVMPSDAACSLWLDEAMSLGND